MNYVSQRVFTSSGVVPDRLSMRGYRLDGATGPIEVRPHPDKAISQRSTIIAALGDGVSRISNLADCRDVRRNLDCLVDLGIALDTTAPNEIEIRGRGPLAISPQNVTLDAGNSATTARLLAATVAGSRAEVVITGNDALRARPMAEVIGPLREIGAQFLEVAPGGHLPFRVRGGRLAGGTASITVDSAQPVSAALLAAALADGPSTIVRRVPARDHTERLLRWVGVQIHETAQSLYVEPRPWGPFELQIPGDPSGAAYLAGVHLVSPSSDRPLVIRDVCVNPRRLGFFEVVKRMGVLVEISNQRDLGPEPFADLTVRATGPLQAVTISSPELVQSAIDELPMIAALAAQAEGETRIENAFDLKGKDTDRVATTVDLLRQFGVRASPTPDGLVVRQSEVRWPTLVHLPNDHRVIFAGILLGLLAGGYGDMVGAQGVATSHPQALNELALWVMVNR